MKSKEYRNNEIFLRNGYNVTGKYNIPLMEKQEIELTDISLVSFNDTRSKDSKANRNKGVHFFIDDYRFNGIFNNPEKSYSRLSQYKFLLTPDFSLYAEMPIWRQIESVGKNRWCGVYWQEKGLKVIPTISWSNSLSYEFCFDGVKENSIVAVGMIGCKNAKSQFMRGYNAMIERLSPLAVICLGEPFAEMRGNVIAVDYIASRKVVR